MLHIDNVDVDLVKCLNCGAKMDELRPQNGDTFLLCCCDAKTNTYYSGNGIRLRAFFCQDCGNVQLKAPKP